ncbi:hypothetical protein NEHOM01_0096 [Nematocida homosporus]|uniref:uncharacterized protein n=1 Tax=Nematocida homosporus TaxID=1912981 RepID=UPI00221F5D66|nr:uncharacterized protein NEHOM01_0096 [Nematocida homosporus]KAI5184351.1 hypothetical protein NEHOM01_0096 [Nematocida homosporus]
MSKSKRVFFLETFGEIAARVGYYLLEHRETSLIGLCGVLKLSKKEVAKALSLLIHFGIVGFNNFRGNMVRYYVQKDLSEMVNRPVYLDWAERTYGMAGLALVMETSLKGVLRSEEVPVEYIEMYRRLLVDGILVDKKVVDNSAGIGTAGLGIGDGLVKRAKVSEKQEEKSGEKEKRCLVLSKEKIKARIVADLFEAEIERRFTKGTRVVFAVINNQHPVPATLRTVLQKLEGVELGKDGCIIDGEKMEREEWVQEHLHYLKAFGVISGPFEKYSVNYDWFLQQIKIGLVTNYVQTVSGESVSTVLSMLLSRGYVEDRFVQKYTLMDASVCKKALFTLLTENIVVAQMVPRTPDCLPSKSFHFWRADPDKVLSSAHHIVYEKINHLYFEIEHSRESKYLLSRADYKHKQETLLGQLERLHTMYFVLGL